MGVAGVDVDVLVVDTGELVGPPLPVLPAPELPEPLVADPLPDEPVPVEVPLPEDPEVVVPEFDDPVVEVVPLVAVVPPVLVVPAPLPLVAVIVTPEMPDGTVTGFAVLTGVVVFGGSVVVVGFEPPQSPLGAAVVA